MTKSSFPSSGTWRNCVIPFIMKNCRFDLNVSIGRAAPTQPGTIKCLRIMKTMPETPLDGPVRGCGGPNFARIT